MAHDSVRWLLLLSLALPLAPPSTLNPECPNSARVVTLPYRHYDFHHHPTKLISLLHTQHATTSTPVADREQPSLTTIIIMHMLARWPMLGPIHEQQPFLHSQTLLFRLSFPPPGPPLFSILEPSSAARPRQCSPWAVALAALPIHSLINYCPSASWLVSFPHQPFPLHY